MRQLQYWSGQVTARPSKHGSTYWATLCGKGLDALLSPSQASSAASAAAPAFLIARGETMG